jgi:hypothetical protein
MKKVGFVLLFTYSFWAQAQKSVSIRFEPIYNQFRLEPNLVYPNLVDSIQFQELKFYIGHVQLYNDDSLVAIASHSHYLIDIHQNQTVTLSIPNQASFNQLRFQLGVDSITSVSGALEGDLDPSLGMYWTWQSGYIHSKIEATVFGSNRNKTQFTYHLGGYQYPYNSLQTIQLGLVQTETIKIEVDIAAFLEHEEVLKQSVIMSPKPASLVLSQIFAHSFKVSQK